MLKSVSFRTAILGLISSTLMGMLTGCDQGGPETIPLNPQPKQVSSPQIPENLPTFRTHSTAPGAPSGNSLISSTSEQIPVQAALAKSCFEQICSSTIEIKFLLAIDSAQDEELFQKLVPMINNFYADSILTQGSDQEILKKLDFEKIQVSSELADITLVKILAEKISQFSEFIFKTADSPTYVFNRAAYLKLHGTDQDVMSGEILDVLDGILKLPTYQLFLNGYGWDDITGRQIPSENSKNSIEDFNASVAADCLRIQNEVSNLTGENENSSLALKKAQAKQELSAFENSEIMKQHLTCEIMNAALHGSLHGSFANSKFKDSSLYKALSSIPVEKILKFEKTDLEKKNQSCLKNVYLAIKHSVTTAENEQLLKTLQLAKESGKKVATQLISSQHLLARVMGLIDSSRFIPLQNKVQTQQIIAEYFNNQNPHETGPKPPEMYWSERLLAAMDAQGRDQSALECGSFIPATLSDYTKTNFGSIVLSEVSGKNANLGLAIAGHELGHIVFNALDVDSRLTQNGSTLEGKDSLNEVLACELSRVGNDRKYLDESFADGFSARILKLAGPMTAPLNLGCALQKYRNSSLTVINPSATETHPTEFFRSLAYQQDLVSALPQECSAYLHSQNVQDFVSCY